MSEGSASFGVRREVILDDSDDRLLEEWSKSTDLSVSELIRRAIRETYGSERKLSWDEVFAHPVEAGSAKGESWVYDPLFDSDIDELIDRQLDGLLDGIIPDNTHVEWGSDVGREIVEYEAEDE